MTAPSLGVSRSDDKKSTPAKTRRKYTFRDYLSRKVLVMLALGFSSGLPFLLVGNTLGFWLRDEGTALKAISFISWVGIAYSLQWAWGPFLDRVPVLKVLGQRRGWLLLTQLCVAAALAAMAAVGTGHGLVVLGALALVAAFASSVQDIAIAAWRIESASDADELGLLTAAYTLAYRIAMICTDSLILVSAQHLGWPVSYGLCAAAMAIGIGATLLAPEPKQANAVMTTKEQEAPLWSLKGFMDAVFGPFIVFFKTHGTMALLMLLAITLYRAPDFMRGPMVNPFFHDLGMSKDAIGLSRATVGLATTFLGVAAAGFVSARLGLMRTLIMGAVLQAIGIAANALLIYSRTDMPVFMLVMGTDDFALGFAGISLVAYMSSLTNLGYVATQYGVLSAAYALAGKFLKGFSGSIVDALTPGLGLMHAYATLFLGSAAMAVPSIALFLILDRHARKASINRA